MLLKIQIPAFFNEHLNEFIKYFLPNNTSQFILELTDSKGSKVKYDFETSKLTANSSILTISKYLFLLGLFLF